ncbi:MAG: hypothetical protein HY761_01220 [Candidatus Omnitrophica bacterium]|nr:hypothetical protein [Candidatus Omnitrophota bacterium]
MNYFYIGLTLPNDSFWVNLRPAPLMTEGQSTGTDSPNNIIDSYLSKTDIGRILLEADVQLKKDTSSYTNPATPIGKQYWNKLYKKASDLFGTDQITIPTLTRPWIVPGEIIIRESLSPVASVGQETGDRRQATHPSAYIYKATLKVMLEEDYLKGLSPKGTVPGSTDYSFTDPRLKELNSYSTELIKELIIPKLTKEVNSSKRYSKLRQVYYSLILAQWFKSRQKGLSPKGTVPDLIDSKNLSNLTSKTTWDKATYFNQYQQSFTKGEYNTKETVYTPSGQVIRSYMSGGITLMQGSFPIQQGATFESQAGSPIKVVPANSPIPETLKNIAVEISCSVLNSDNSTVQLIPEVSSEKMYTPASSSVVNHETSVGQLVLLEKREFRWLPEDITKVEQLIPELKKFSRGAEGVVKQEVAISLLAGLIRKENSKSIAAFEDLAGQIKEFIAPKQRLSLKYVSLKIINAAAQNGNPVALKLIKESTSDLIKTIIAIEQKGDVYEGLQDMVLDEMLALLIRGENNALLEIATALSQGLRENLPSSQDINEIKGIRQLFKQALNMSGLKVIFKLREIAAIRATNSLIQALELDTEDIIYGYCEELNKKMVQEAIEKGELPPGYSTKKYTDSADQHQKDIVVIFNDNQSLGRSADKLQLPYYIFKYGLPEPLPQEIVARMRQEMNIGKRKVIVAGSVDRQEIGVLMAAYNSLYRNLPVEQRPLLVLAPRDIIDLDDVDLSQPDAPLVLKQGELLKSYALADVCIVGSDRNILEPSSQRKLVLYFSGYWRSNQQAKDMLVSSGGAIEFNQDNLSLAVNNPQITQELGEKGFKIVQEFKNKIIPQTTDIAAIFGLSLLIKKVAQQRAASSVVEKKTETSSGFLQGSSSSAVAISDFYAEQLKTKFYISPHQQEAIDILEKYKAYFSSGMNIQQKDGDCFSGGVVNYAQALIGIIAGFIVVSQDKKSLVFLQAQGLVNLRGMVNALEFLEKNKTSYEKRGMIRDEVGAIGIGFSYQEAKAGIISGVVIVSLKGDELLVKQGKNRSDVPSYVVVDIWGRPMVVTIGFADKLMSAAVAGRRAKIEKNPSERERLALEQSQYLSAVIDGVSIAHVGDYFEANGNLFIVNKVYIETDENGRLVSFNYFGEQAPLQQGQLSFASRRLQLNHYYQPLSQKEVEDFLKARENEKQQADRRNLQVNVESLEKKVNNGLNWGTEGNVAKLLSECEKAGFEDLLGRMRNVCAGFVDIRRIYDTYGKDINKISVLLEQLAFSRAEKLVEVLSLRSQLEEIIKQIEQDNGNKAALEFWDKEAKHLLGKVNKLLGRLEQDASWRRRQVARRQVPMKRLGSLYPGERRQEAKELFCDSENPVTIIIGSGTILEIGKDSFGFFVVRANEVDREFGRRVYISEQGIKIGSDRQTGYLRIGDVVSTAHKDSLVSREHLEISVIDQQTIKLADKGSLNGTSYRVFEGELVNPVYERSEVEELALAVAARLGGGGLYFDSDKRKIGENRVFEARDSLEVIFGQREGNKEEASENLFKFFRRYGIIFIYENNFALLGKVESVIPVSYRFFKRVLLIKPWYQKGMENILGFYSGRIQSLTEGYAILGQRGEQETSEENRLTGVHEANHGFDSSEIIELNRIGKRVAVDATMFEYTAYLAMLLVEDEKAAYHAYMEMYEVYQQYNFKGNYPNPNIAAQCRIIGEYQEQGHHGDSLTNETIRKMAQQLRNNYYNEFFGFVPSYPDVWQAFSKAQNASSAVTGDSSTKLGVNSRLETGDTKGGIDFRSLPIVTQAVSNLGLTTMNQELRNRLMNFNLSSELNEIEKLTNAGITPSTQRIKEYIQASSISINSPEDTQKLLSCIADILRKQEEECCPTDPTLKDILVVLESGIS